MKNIKKKLLLMTLLATSAGYAATVEEHVSQADFRTRRTHRSVSTTAALRASIATGQTALGTDVTFERLRAILSHHSTATNGLTPTCRYGVFLYAEPGTPNGEMTQVTRVTADAIAATTDVAGLIRVLNSQYTAD